MLLRNNLEIVELAQRGSEAFQNIFNEVSRIYSNETRPFRIGMSLRVFSDCLSRGQGACSYSDGIYRKHRLSPSKLKTIRYSTIGQNYMLFKMRAEFKP